MADVQVSQTPGGTERGGGANWAWALVVIALIALVAWFIFGGGFGGRGDRVDVDVNTPGAGQDAGGGTQKTP
jgi:hypothetical protein